MKKIITSGYFLVGFSALGFSFKAILVKIAYGYGIDAVTLMIMRIFISLPLFFATVLLLEGRKIFHVTFNDLMLFAFMGIICTGCAMLFSFYSIELIGASLSTLVVFTYPSMTMIMLIIFFREEITIVKILSLITTFVGVIFVLRIDHMKIGDVNITGISYGLLAAFFFAIYNTLSEKAMKTTTPIRLVFYSAVFLALFFGLFFPIRDYPGNFEVWGIAALLGIFSGFLPFICLMYGVKKIGAGRAVVISSLGPAMTILWASIFIGEQLDKVQITGMFIIVSGVMLVKIKNPAKAISTGYYGSKVG